MAVQGEETQENVSLDAEKFINHLETLHAQQMAQANRAIAERDMALEQAREIIDTMTKQLETYQTAANREQRRAAAKPKKGKK